MIISASFGLLLVATAQTIAAPVLDTAGVMDKRKFINSPSSVGVVVDVPITQDVLNTFQPTLLNTMAQVLPQVEIGSIPQLIKLPLLPRIDLNLTQVKFQAPVSIDVNASTVTIKDGYLELDMIIRDLKGTMKLNSNVALVGSKGQVSLVAKETRLQARLALSHDAVKETISPVFQTLSLKFTKKLSINVSGSPSRLLINGLSDVLPGLLASVVSLRLQQQTREYGPWLFANILKISLVVPSLMPNRPSDTFHLAFPSPPKIVNGKLVLSIAIRGGLSAGIRIPSVKDSASEGPSSFPLTTIDEEGEEPAKNKNDTTTAAPGPNTLIDEAMDDLWMYGDKPPKKH